MGDILHQKHERDTGHEPPVDLPDDLLVEGGHLFIAEISQFLKSVLDLSRREDAIFDLLRRTIGLLDEVDAGSLLSHVSG